MILAVPLTIPHRHGTQGHLHGHHLEDRPDREDLPCGRGDVREGRGVAGVTVVRCSVRDDKGHDVVCEGVEVVAVMPAAAKHPLRGADRAGAETFDAQVGVAKKALRDRLWTHVTSPLRFWSSGRALILA